MLVINHEDLDDGAINGIVDKTNNGKCSGCGECCSRLLPVSKKDQKEIIRYYKKKEVHLSLGGTPLNLDNLYYHICPFLDTGTKQCAIYPVRPSICKDFLCSQPDKSIRNRNIYLKRYELIDMFDLLKECME